MLKPLLDELYLEIIEENRDKIKVRKEDEAVRDVENIFNAAMRLSQKMGFNTVSLQDISQETGLSMETLDSYFESKDDIRSYILKYGPRFIAEIMNASVDVQENPIDRLAAAIRIHLYLSEALRSWFYFAYMEARNLPREEQKQAMATERVTETMFIEILKDGAASGEFEIKDLYLTGAVIKAMIQDWYLKRWKYKALEINVEQYSEFIINFLMDSIGSSRSRS